MNIITAFDDMMVPIATPETITFAERVKQSVIRSKIPDEQKEQLLSHLVTRSVARMSRIDSVDSDDFGGRSLIILDDRATARKLKVMSVLFRRHVYVCTSSNAGFVRPHNPVHGNVWTFWYNNMGRNSPAVSLFVYNCMPHYYIHAFAAKTLMYPMASNKDILTKVIQCLHEAFKRTPEAIREHISIRLAIQRRRKRFADEVKRINSELPEYVRYMTMMGDSMLYSLLDAAQDIVRKSARSIMSKISSTIVELVNSGYSVKPVPKEVDVPDGYVPLFAIDIEIYPKMIRYEDTVYAIPDNIYREYKVNENLYVKGLVICGYGNEYRQVAIKAKHPNVNGRTRSVCDFSSSKDIKEAAYKAINELQVCNLDSCFGNEAEAYCRWLLDKLEDHGVEGADIYSSNSSTKEG